VRYGATTFVPSDTRPSIVHSVRLSLSDEQNAVLDCTCEGYRSYRHCKHVRRVAEKTVVTCPECDSAMTFQNGRLVSGANLLLCNRCECTIEC
jgi:hypothetical protein